MEEIACSYDVIVIGAGPVGENVADRTRAAGLSTVIVESELVGGECSFWACEPSKALLRPVVARADARRVPGLNRAVDGPLDVAAVLARRDDLAAHWNDEDQVLWLESISVDLLRGHGRLTGPRQVSVRTLDGLTLKLTARQAVAVCTGTSAVLPPVSGLDAARPWTSREATSSRHVPNRLAIVGGGVVAVEMATAWQALGSQVTLLVREEGLLERMEPFVSEIVAGSLREVGVDVLFKASVSSVVRTAEEGEVQITLDGGDVVVADEILVAVGRAPRTTDVGLEAVGLTPGDWLAVDETCRVSAVADGWLYAVGDVNRRALLTHQGKYQARIAGAAIAARALGRLVDDGDWGAHAATADHLAVPQVVFTQPEIASAGMTAAEAERCGRRIRVVDYEVGYVAGAQQYAEDYRGKARMVIDLDRGFVIGATFIGPGVAELVHSATMAIAGEVPVERLWHVVPAFPTIGEVWLRLLETYRG